MKKGISKRIFAAALASGMLLQTAAMADYLPKSVTGVQEYSEPVIAEQINDNAELMATTEDGWEYYTSNRYIVISGIDEDKISGDITIPSEIDGISVTEIGWGAFEYCTSLTSVTIPDSVTEIGWGAFEYCTSLTSVTIPDSVTKIGEWAFLGCTSLTSVTIPDSVTEIDGSMFRGCTSLTSVTIPDSVTKIGYEAFLGCTSLTSITIPESVTEIDRGAFEGCGSLNITVSENNKNYSSIDGVLFNKDKTELIAYAKDKIQPEYIILDSVTYIGMYAFYGCTSLTSVTIPDSVTEIGWGAFRGCTSLTSVTIHDGVTKIGGYAFYGCTSLESVTIPDSVTEIEHDAFEDTAYYNNQDNWENDVLYISNCLIGVKDIVKECNIKAGTRLIASGVFVDHQNLTSIKIPESVTKIGICLIFSGGSSIRTTVHRTFGGCGSLNITVDENNKNYSSSDGVLFDKDKTKLIVYANDKIQPEYIIPDSVTEIGLGAFGGCEGLMSVIIPSGVTYIDSDEFYNCRNLTSIIIPNGVTEIGDEAFYDCTSLTSVTIPDSVTEIGEGAFECCESLTSITIPDSVTEIADWVFGGCTSLTSVTIPDSVTEIGEGAFECCESLISITIPNSVTEIGDEAFYECTSLESITIPGSVTYIGEDAFYGCTSLESITIPDSVTYIGEGAFECCTSLTSITIPDSVTEIGDRVFEDCDNLTIYGYAGSYAEEYANENDIPFKAINKYTASTKIKDGKATVTFTAIDENAEQLPENAIIVQYNSSGNISGLDENIKIENKTATVNASEEVKYIKIFNWDSLDSMKPRGEALMIPIKK